MIEIQITDKMPLEKAMRILKKKLVKEGVFKELKVRRFYEKPSERAKRKKDEAKRRRKKFKRRYRKY